MQPIFSINYTVFTVSFQSILIYFNSIKQQQYQETSCCMICSFLEVEYFFEFLVICTCLYTLHMHLSMVCLKMGWAGNPQELHFVKCMWVEILTFTTVPQLDCHLGKLKGPRNEWWVVCHLGKYPEVIWASPRMAKRKVRSIVLLF